MLRPTLHKKVLFALLAIGLIPLGGLTLYSLHSLSSLAEYLRSSATAALDNQSSAALELRSGMVADAVAAFLRRVEGDLHDLAQLPVTAAAYGDFCRRHTGQIWYRAGTNAQPREVREVVPLYREAAFVGSDGRERLRVDAGGNRLPLRDVARPENTSFRSEDYFQRARSLPAGATYLSPVTGWHVDKLAQLGDAETPEAAVEGASYQGVVRFATSLRTPEGVLRGVVVLTLDHRHLMEFTQHLVPTPEREVLFPSYGSGNYAFMFDRDGWMIAHPKYWDIRGLDPDGRLVPPYSAASSAEDVARGRIPFNLVHAGFIHPNYPRVAAAVLEGKTGVVDVTNVGGARKVMAYAPIRAPDGTIFGGVTIGSQVDLFHLPAQQTAEVIRGDLRRYLRQTAGIIALTALLAVVAAYLLARGVTRPLLRLMEGTRAMARGELATRVEVESTDEVGRLGASFNTMASELQERSERLLRTLDELRRSRLEILRERNFKETVYENIETGILTLDRRWRVTSANGPALRLLQLQPVQRQTALTRLLRDWPDLLAAVREARRRAGSGRWSSYVPIAGPSGERTFRLALLPLSREGEEGRILTVEDLTERVQIRQRMARMERLVSLGRLSAGIAHEVRNPLTGISLLLDELHDRLLAQPTDQQLIRRALQEIERLESLVSELLNFASLPQRPLELGDVVVVLQETLFFMRKQCRHAGIELREEIPAALPPIPLDAGKLKQALLNLMSNAIEAMPQGGTLRVAAQLDGDSIRIDVADSGPGIAPEQVPLIFEPFYTSKGEGTGLGLAITHNIITEHNGRIEVASHRHEGATFSFWLPLPGGGDAGSA